MKKLPFTLFLFSINLMVCHSQSNDERLINAYGLSWSNQHQMAIKSFSDLIDSKNYSNADLYLNRGISYFHLANYSQASHDFELARQQGIKKAQLWLARTSVVIERPKEALAHLDHYLKVIDNVEYVQIRRDTLFKSLHALEDWVSLWQSERMTEEIKLIDQAFSFLRAKDFTGTHNLIESYIPESDDKAQLFAFNAEIYKTEENYQLALYEINRAINLEGSNLDFLFQKLKYLRFLGRDKDEFIILSEILDIKPHDFNTRYQRAECAYRINELQTAQDDLERCLEFSQSAKAQFLFGKINYAKGSYLDALRVLNPLIQKDSTNAVYLLTRGKTYYQTHTNKSAAYDLSMSLDLDPNNPETNYYMGLVEKALGNSDMACFYFKRARKNGELRAQKRIDTLCL